MVVYFVLCHNLHFHSSWSDQNIFSCRGIPGTKLFLLTFHTMWCHVLDSFQVSSRSKRIFQLYFGRRQVQTTLKTAPCWKQPELVEDTIRRAEWKKKKESIKTLSSRLKSHWSHFSISRCFLKKILQVKNRNWIFVWSGLSLSSSLPVFAHKSEWTGIN